MVSRTGECDVVVTQSQASSFIVDLLADELRLVGDKSDVEISGILAFIVSRGRLAVTFSVDRDVFSSCACVPVKSVDLVSCGAVTATYSQVGLRFRSLAAEPSNTVLVLAVVDAIILGERVSVDVVSNLDRKLKLWC
jgi:hypothetical protein